MKVYVLQGGDWETGELLGVFATPELAMAAWRPERGTPIWTQHETDRWVGRLSKSGDVEVDVTAFEVQGISTP